jgi:hypothetical protein
VCFYPSLEVGVSLFTLANSCLGMFLPVCNLPSFSRATPPGHPWRSSQTPACGVCPGQWGERCAARALAPVRSGESKGVAGERGEAGVPHQAWIEGCVDGQRHPTLIARSRTVRADNQVVVNTDGNGLCVAEAIGRSAACTGIIVVQATDKVRPEGAAQLSPFRVDRPA